MNHHIHTVESASSYLDSLVIAKVDQEYRNVAWKVLSDERFRHTTGSSDKHHVGDGQLLVHTAQVINIALNSLTGIAHDSNVVVIGGLWHDFGKIWDYQLKSPSNGIITFTREPQYEKTDHAKEIRHLARSYAEFMIVAREHNLPEELTNKIGHVILSHHGRKEWGSPVEPVTVEAWAIHSADMMSAHYIGA